MRFEMVQMSPGVLRSVPYLECWRCGVDVLETDLSMRDMCRRCAELAEDGFIGIDDDEEDW